MKHATAETLNLLAPLLMQLRALPKLQERKLGTFYRTSKAYLHFHEDPLGFFADVRLDGCDFARFPVNSAKEQAALLSTVIANCTA